MQRFFWGGLMQARCWILGLAFSAAAVGPASAANFIPDGARFSSESTIGAPGTITNPMLTSAFEHGELEGRDYYIYSNGRAMYGQWQLYCSTDNMTDARSCTVMQEDFWVSVEKGGVAALVIGDKHHPGTPVQLRLDKAQPVTSKTFGWSGKAAAKLVADATKAQTMFTRFTRWPEDAPTTRTMSAEGLSVAIRIAQWMVNQKPSK